MFHSRGLSIVCCVMALSAPAVLGAQAPRVIALSASDNMRFDVTQISARPGESLRVRLTVTGSIPKVAMGHNFVLLARDANPSAFVAAAATAQATGYIPAKLKANILASTSLAGPRETVEVTFKAPTQPGKYVFLCSFPGHYSSGMTGTLTVK